MTKLADLFARLDPSYFHPHPMTPEHAAWVEAYDGQDVYLWTDHAYGFLRGWDEGYAVPSLGIAVATDSQGKGHGRAMMLRLHEEAWKRGAPMIRLRVHPDNVRARRLYESMGYVEAGVERGELLMLLRPDEAIGDVQRAEQAARSARL
jgi:ribosomal-protein-alanine N-acetyltransferase